jgi:hypothetical protein
MKKIIFVGVVLLSLPAYSQTYYPQPEGWNDPWPTQSTTQQSTPRKKCNEFRSLIGAVVGGGTAAAISKQDAYGWSIPLGAVLGAGFGRVTCK